ncbi:adenylate kinase [Aciditerrimonas ferrireducens]|uniref:Adenylate kinase n=1 Tax=Aciditerrimonas ferrireducens TaxID=667306 RepID=A0ABV6C491_9ACTN|nr:adenylate kinase [Aciditerrimonas ferrireducens]MCK4176126.1 adenylate kinase [Aciditerrimonas ferrireducens]
MVPGARLVVLGKQGAGKGTQCVRLSHLYVVPHISTGDMLRAAVKSGSPLGEKIREVMDRGELLSDELVGEMVAQRLAEPDARARGFILDGYPRTVRQAEMLAQILAPLDIDLAIDIEVPTERVLKRLADRRVCSDCGANYSVQAPPKVNWTCDVCGGEVVQREDDTEEAIRRRLALYERETAPLIAWYAERGQLAQVNGVGTVEAVSRRIVRAIEERRSPRPARPRRRGTKGGAS